MRRLARLPRAVGGENRPVRPELDLGLDAIQGVEQETLRHRGQPLSFLDALRTGSSTHDAVRVLAESMLRAAHGVGAPPAGAAVRLDLRAFDGMIPEEMFGRTSFPAIGELPYLLTLGPRGFFWFQLRKDDSE